MKLSWTVATDCLATPPAESGWNGEEIMIHTYSAVGWTPSSFHQKMAPQNPTSKKLSSLEGTASQIGPASFLVKSPTDGNFRGNKRCFFSFGYKLPFGSTEKKSIHPNWDLKKTGMPNIYSFWGGYPSKIKPTLNEEEHQWHALQVRCFWGEDFSSTLQRPKFQVILGVGIYLYFFKAFRRPFRINT